MIGRCLKLLSISIQFNFKSYLIFLRYIFTMGNKIPFKKFLFRLLKAHSVHFQLEEKFYTDQWRHAIVSYSPFGLIGSHNPSAYWACVIDISTEKFTSTHAHYTRVHIKSNTLIVLKDFPHFCLCRTKKYYLDCTCI